MAAVGGAAVQKTDMQDTEVVAEVETGEKKPKWKSHCRIQIRGLVKKTWHSWVNDHRRKKKLEPHKAHKFYDYSFVRAATAASISAEVFVTQVQKYKAQYGHDGFIAMLKKCGLHREDVNSQAKGKVVSTLQRCFPKLNKESKKVDGDVVKTASLMAKHLRKKIKELPPKTEIKTSMLRTWLLQEVSIYI